METKNWEVVRYEEKSDALFICINHTEKPVYIEHFFSADERKDEASIIARIEKLVAQLEIMADEYVEPEKFVSKVDVAKAFKLDTKKIADAKAEIISAKSSIIEEL